MIRRMDHYPHLLLLVVLAATAMLIAQDKGPAGDVQPVERHFAFNPGGTVSVSNDRGSTTIEGWDKNEVDIQAVKHYEGDAEYRDRWLRETEVRIENTSSSVTVKIVRPSIFCVGWCNYRGWVDVSVKAPRKVSVETNSDRTPTKINSIEGDIHMSGDRSPLDLRNVAGSLHIRSDRGPVHLDGVDVRNSVDIRTDRAPIELYATRFNAGGRLETDRGAITIRVPSNTALNVEVAGDRRSSFRSEFDLSTSGDLGRGTIHGKINGGGPTLRMGADRGSISLQKGGTSM